MDHILTLTLTKDKIGQADSVGFYADFSLLHFVGKTGVGKESLQHQTLKKDDKFVHFVFSINVGTTLEL